MKTHCLVSIQVFESKLYQFVNCIWLADATSKRGTAMATVVSDWIDRYNENKESAALELINYVIEVSY